jgi:hypothetical protein
VFGKPNLAEQIPEPAVPCDGAEYRVAQCEGQIGRAVLRGTLQQVQRGLEVAELRIGRGAGFRGHEARPLQVFQARPPHGPELLNGIGMLGDDSRLPEAVITHNAAIAGMADRVIRMRSGAIAEIVRNEQRRPPAELSW